MAKLAEQTAALPAIKVKRGRQAFLTPNMVNEAYEYLDSFQDNGGIVPSKQGLALHLGVAVATLFRWENDKSDDKRAIREVIQLTMQLQHEYLVSGGLSSKYNPTITKLMLSKHGYTEADNNQGVTINVNVNRDGHNVVIDGTLDDNHEE